MSAGTRERILEAAVSCFAEHGYSGTKTRAVATRAGVNVATLAYHFGDKEGLYRAAVDSLYERIRGVEPDVRLDPERAPAELLELVVRFCVGFTREHRAEVRLLLRHVLDAGVLPERIHTEWLEPLLLHAASLWAQAGLPPRDDWRLVLLTLNHLVVRYAVTDERDLSPFVPEGAGEPFAAVEDHLVSVACRILLPGKGLRAD